MKSIIDVFLSNPTLLISVIVFFACVVIGFFGDQYLKKNKDTGVGNKVLNNVENANDDLSEKKEVIDKAEDNNINDSRNNDAFVNSNPEDVAIPQNAFIDEIVSKDNEISYINNDDNFTNIF